jgi:hypothetical protein
VLWFQSQFFTSTFAGLPDLTDHLTAIGTHVVSVAHVVSVFMCKAATFFFSFTTAKIVIVMSMSSHYTSLIERNAELMSINTCTQPLLPYTQWQTSVRNCPSGTARQKNHSKAESIT